jgi:hypothetical protein
MAALTLATMMSMTRILFLLFIISQTHNNPFSASHGSRQCRALGR